MALRGNGQETVIVRPKPRSREGEVATRTAPGRTQGGAAGGGYPRRSEAYWIAFTMSKIGRYMATTMPPTITPSTTIITGSISERSALTATSTSAS